MTSTNGTAHFCATFLLLFVRAVVKVNVNANKINAGDVDDGVTES